MNPHSIVLFKAEVIQRSAIGSYNVVWFKVDGCANVNGRAKMDGGDLWTICTKVGPPVLEFRLRIIVAGPVLVF